MVSTEIQTLAGHPDSIPRLAGWFFSEWNSFDGRSRSDIEAQLRQNLSGDSIPITFLALRAGDVVGSVSLDLSDLPGFDHLSPWLASLFVAPECRGTGVGTALVEHAIDFARTKRIPTLYLWTPGSTRFYERCGWEIFQRTTYSGRPIAVLRRTE